MDFWEKYHKSEICFNHMIWKAGVSEINMTTSDINPEHLIKVLFARFLHCKDSIFSPCHTLFFRRESLALAGVAQ